MLVDPKFRQALRDRRPLVLLVEIDHPSRFYRFWSSVGTLRYQGNDYIGAGMLGGIEVTRRSTELRLDEIKFWLSGVDPDELTGLLDDVRNRPAYSYLAAVDEQSKVIGTPFLLDEVLLDYQQETIGANGECRVEIIGQSGFWTLQRPTYKVYSREEWIRRFPLETGLDLVPTLRNKDTKWTRT